MNKVEGKVSDWCPKCKNCNGITRESNGVHVWLTEVECEDQYNGLYTKTLNVDSDICCSMFEPKKEKESFKLNMSREQLKSKILDLFEEKNRLNDIINGLEKSRDGWRERYYEVRYALRKDETLDGSISCVRDIPSDVEMIEDLKKRAADSDYYKEMSELLEERKCVRRMKQMPEFILFQGRILRKDLIKSVYTSYDRINHTLQPTVEFVGETDPLMIGSPVDSPEEALETIYEFYRMLGGDINDVITCREQMKSLLNGEEPMDDE